MSFKENSKYFAENTLDLVLRYLKEAEPKLEALIATGEYVITDHPFPIFGFLVDSENSVVHIMIVLEGSEFRRKGYRYLRGRGY